MVVVNQNTTSDLKTIRKKICNFYLNIKFLMIERKKS